MDFQVQLTHLSVFAIVPVKVSRLHHTIKFRSISEEGDEIGGEDGVPVLNRIKVKFLQRTFKKQTSFKCKKKKSETCVRRRSKN